MAVFLQDNIRFHPKMQLNSLRVEYAMVGLGLSPKYLLLTKIKLLHDFINTTSILRIFEILKIVFYVLYFRFCNFLSMCGGKNNCIIQGIAFRGGTRV